MSDLKTFCRRLIFSQIEKYMLELPELKSDFEQSLENFRRKNDDESYNVLLSKVNFLRNFYSSLKSKDLETVMVSNVFRFIFHYAKSRLTNDSQVKIIDTLINACSKQTRIEDNKGAMLNLYYDMLNKPNISITSESHILYTVKSILQDSLMGTDILVNMNKPALEKNDIRNNGNGPKLIDSYSFLAKISEDRKRKMEESDNEIIKKAKTEIVLVKPIIKF